MNFRAKLTTLALILLPLSAQNYPAEYYPADQNYPPQNYSGDSYPPEQSYPQEYYPTDQNYPVDQSYPAEYYPGDQSYPSEYYPDDQSYPSEYYSEEPSESCSEYDPNQNYSQNRYYMDPNNPSAYYTDQNYEDGVQYTGEFHNEGCSTPYLTPLPADVNAVYIDEYPDESCPEYYDPRVRAPLCRGFDLGLEFLFWKPCHTEIDFAAHREETIEDTEIYTRYQRVALDWAPGFRLTFYSPCFFDIFDVDLRYAYLSRTSSQYTFVDEGSLVSPLIHPGLYNFVEVFIDPPEFPNASATVTYNFHQWDALFAYQTLVDCVNVRYNFGPSGLFLNRRLTARLYDAESPEEEVRYDWQSDIWGIGLKVGTYAEYYMCPTISFFSEISGAVYAGEYYEKNRHFYQVLVQDEPESVEWNYKAPDSNSLLIPVLHLKVGLRKDLVCFNQIMHLKFGYEFQNYWNVTTPRTYFGFDNFLTNTQSTAPNIGYFGFQGIFAGLDATF